MSCVQPPIVVEPWLLLAGQWEGFTQSDQLQGLAVTTDHQPLTIMEDQLWRGPLHQAGLLQQGPGALECVTCGGGWVVVL